MQTGVRRFALRAVSHRAVSYKHSVCKAERPVNVITSIVFLFHLVNFGINYLVRHTMNIVNNPWIPQWVRSVVPLEREAQTQGADMLRQGIVVLLSLVIRNHNGLGRLKRD